MKITTVSTDDAEAVRDVIVAAMADHWHTDFDDEGRAFFMRHNTAAAIATRLGDARYLTLCCRDNGGMVGIITMRDFQKIDQLFVLPQFRSRGVATQLWREAKARCATQGNRGHYRVRSSSLAVPVYRRFGFELQGPRRVEHGTTYYPMVYRGEGAPNNIT